MSEHDFSISNRWGHNIEILNWNKEMRSGRAICWVTPGMREGDIVIVKSERGTMRLEATKVRKMPNVDDMYAFDINEVAFPIEKEELWVAKVRRNGGGMSVLDVATTKEKAQALVDEFNTQYQTDNYYIEPYNKELHAYSRNR